MSIRAALAYGLILALLGAGGLVYLTGFHSPEPLLLAAFFPVLFVAAAGWGMLLALILHRRWPRLAGNARNGFSAVRQGIWIGLAAPLLAGMQLLQLLDVALAIVLVLLFGLLEAFVQERQRRHV